MKVLLINPGWDSLVSAKGSRFNRPWPPLDLLNCAALLEKEGFEVHLLDIRASPLDIKQIAQRATKFDTCFITSSPIDRWQCPNIDLYPFLELVSLLPKKGLHQAFTPHNFLNQTGNTGKTHFTFTTQHSPSTKEDMSNWGNNGFLSGLWFEDKKDNLNQTIRKALSGFYMRWQYVYGNMLFCNPFSSIRKLRLFYNYWKSLK